MTTNEIEYQSKEGKWNLSKFNGCSGLVVSHNSYINTHFRGKGLGNLEHEKRIRWAKDLNYSCMICTVKNDNEVQRHILMKHGWVKVWEFFNTKTNNLIDLWVKNI